MDCGSSKRQLVKNPRKNPSLLSSFTFAWLLDTYRLGWKRELTVFDLSPPVEPHTSQYLGKQLIDLWNEEKESVQNSKQRKQPSLVRTMKKFVGKEAAVIGICTAAGEIVSKIAQPLFLVKILQYFNEANEMTRDEALMWGTALFISNIFYSCISHVSIYYMMVVAMKIRTSCCVLLYEKIMHMSKAVMQSKTSAGQMINIFSTDMNRMDFLFPFIHYSWISPILVLIAFIFICREMSTSGLVGFSVLLICFPIQGYIAKFVSNLAGKHSQLTDKRLRLTNEIIKGVQVIKMYAWEKPFTNLVNKARRMEMKIHSLSNTAFAASLTFEYFIPRTCLFVTIVVYVLSGNQITAEKVFLVSSYYNILRMIAFRRFPVSLNTIGELVISIDRVQQFLAYDEIDNTVNRHSNIAGPNAMQDIAIEFEDVTAKWTRDSKKSTLDEVSFAIQTGTLAAVIGQVGAGKSSIFHAILGELPISSGKLNVSGKISYCAQEPWIFASSIQQNILFGQPMDEEKYKKVISACQLQTDFAAFPYGDKTLVGEKGISLSGGQCARVSLARSVYLDADIYLLDDPLSAVDPNVGRNIFEKCIRTYLKGKTVVLVTHQYQYLKEVDQLIVLKKERVEAVGSLEQLQESGLELIQALTVREQEEEVQWKESTKFEIGGTATQEDCTSIKDVPTMKEEIQHVGDVSKDVYLSLAKAAGNPIFIILVLLLIIMTEIFGIGGDYFIAFWLNQEYESLKLNRTTRFATNNYSKNWYIRIYGFMILGTIILNLLHTTCYYEVYRRISNKLYENMFTNVIRATMTFFNENTTGRIMNRFAKDIVVVDGQVSLSFRGIFMSSTTFFIVIILISIMIPLLFLPSVFVIILFSLCRVFYLKTSRSIKRLEGITRSPVFTHLSIVIDGLTTIRALNAQQVLREEFDNHQDVYSAVWIISAAGDRALGFYTDVLCSILLGLITFIIIFVRETTKIGDVGLIITQCYFLIGILQWGIKQSCELETNMTSVERVLEYSHLKEEPPLKSTPRNKPPEGWPKEGRLCFKNVYLMYDERMALKNLNFTIEPKEKIGIVGRTGAGKSSIITALFRLADIKGDILIDDLATSSLGLHDFRSKISIIPQEPVLFMGTLRHNLDPFEEYQDCDLWQALEDVEMKTTIISKESLEMNVSDGGSNFSVGERQLLCLARAVLRKNSILVLDEATANVDPKTDELIQQTVRKKFQNCTVLTIAHRLNTVMDSDRVLVMDAACMVEFDHPFKLLQNKDGYFYNMVQQTGPTISQTLMEIAKQNYPNHWTKI